jgi:membrane protein
MSFPMPVGLSLGSSVSQSTPLERLKQSWVYLLFAEAFASWKGHNTLRLGAALAYYAVFSLGPLLLIVVAVAGFVWGHDAAQGALTGQLRQLAGAAGASVMQALLASTSDVSTNIFASIAGGITLLMGASGVFIELKDALNVIWKVPAEVTDGVWATVRSRVLSFTIILALGFLLLISLVLSAALAALSAYVGDVLPLPNWSLQLGVLSSTFLLTTVLFAMIFKLLPDTRVEWKDVWLGAALSSVLFAVGKILIGLYLWQTSTASAYGAAGGVVVILIWTFYSAQILFFGAISSEAYARLYGSRRDLAVREDRSRPQLLAARRDTAVPASSWAGSAAASYASQEQYQVEQDWQLRQEIEAEFRSDPRIRAQAIVIEVERGVVTLRGAVEGHSGKWAAEEAARRVGAVGVVSEDLTVRIPFHHVRSDVEVSNLVARALTHDVIAPTTIATRVSNGWVSIVGEVDWNYQRQAAERAVRFVSGVVGVTNAIVVKHQK